MPSLHRPRPAAPLVCLLALLSSAACRDSVVAEPRSIAPAGPTRSTSYTTDSPQATVTITHLDQPGFASDGTTINSAGDVGGTVHSDAYLGQSHATIWKADGQVIDLGVLNPVPGAWLSSYVAALNDAGQAVGSSVDNQNGGRGRAFLWTQSTGMVSLGVLPGKTASAAMDINNNGVVVGYSYNFSDDITPFVWSSGTGMVALGTIPGASETYPAAINSAGVVVGWTLTTDGGQYGTRWLPNGPPVVLPSLPGGTWTSGDAINTAGVIAGASSVADGTFRPVLWMLDGRVIDLGLLPGTDRCASSDVNDAREVVGYCYTPENNIRAFYRSADGVMIDLGGLPGQSQSRTYLAMSINNFGVITGYATTSLPQAVTWRVTMKMSPGSTSAGTNITVTPTDATTATSPVTLTFSSVTSPGTTSLTTSSSGYSPPHGFRLGSPATFYDISTSAAFSGPVTICISYAGVSYGNENALQLLHFDKQTGKWVDIRTSLDTTRDLICGVTSSFSPFAVAEPNSPPVVTSLELPSAPIAVGSTVSVTGAFTDAGDLSVHTATIDWGDGTSPSLADVVESNGQGTVMGSHRYLQAGVYTLRVTVSDGEAAGERSSSLGTPAYVVAYDPSAGFVTGGGWIESPNGACRLTAVCAGASGRASFGFVSKYANGASVPTGNTELNFRAGDLRFASTSYQWMVIAGARAQYKGEGAINGSGGYGFLLTAVDADVQGGGTVDAFRIKIWRLTSGEVVYDNRYGAEDGDAPTTIAGGAIRIHR